MRGSCLPHAKFSLQLLKFLLRYSMRIMFGMLFAFWVFSTQKCETFIFAKFGLTFMHVSPLNYLDTQFCREHMCHTCTHMSCMHNVTLLGFTYNVNHVIMTSPVFAFHSCHKEMRWYDIIGVHIA